MLNMNKQEKFQYFNQRLHQIVFRYITEAEYQVDTDKLIAMGKEVDLSSEQVIQMFQEELNKYTNQYKGM